MKRPLVTAVLCVLALPLAACETPTTSADAGADVTAAESAASHGAAPASSVAVPLVTEGPSAAASTAPTTTTPPPTTPAPTTDPPPTASSEPDEPMFEWVPDHPCTVSALLVPSCGAWLGASTPSRADPTDYVAGLAEYESAAHNQPDILHFYKRDAEPFPTSEEIALAERPGQQRSMLFYNWKPSTSLTWREVADGNADASIDSVASGIVQYPHTMFLAVWHEPENDQRIRGTPADYVAMYRHVVTRLRDLGVANVVYVMNFIGFSGWADVVGDFYPGDDVVDWIAYDPYGSATHPDFGAVLNDTTETWPGFYAWATAKAPDKPLMLAEWGIDLDHQPHAAEILDGGVRLLQQRFPQIKALVYWNDHAAQPDGVVVRLDHRTALGAAYAQAYRRFANQTYFNSTDPSLAP